MTKSSTTLNTTIPGMSGYEKIKKTQHMKDTGVEPIDRELTDFEAARTLSKWEDEEGGAQASAWWLEADAALVWWVGTLA